MTTTTKTDLYRVELEAIAKRRKGTLLPEDVVETARDPESVLHERFEWNDQIAGHKYRLEQARALIRIYVTNVDAPEGPVQVRELVNIRGQRGYLPIDKVMSNEDLRAAYLKAVREDFRAFERKWRNSQTLDAKTRAKVQPLWEAGDRIFGDEGRASM